MDHLMVIHAGTGQEAGGGKLGNDAIWSHRSTLGQVYKVPGTNMVLMIIQLNQKTEQLAFLLMNLAMI